MKARNYFEGSNWNQIRSNDTKQVTFKAKKVVHTAAAPWDNDNLEKIHEHSTHKSGAVSRTSEHYWDWNEYWRCDFCGKSGKKDGDAEAMSGQAEQYTKRNLEEALRSAFEKALAPLTDIQRQVDKVGSAVRARYGEEEYAQAGAIYVLEYPVTLEKDVTIDVERIAKYKLWTNTETGHDVYLLPNATRLYGQARGGKINLDYVAEVIRGNGEIAEIDIITALTKRAFANPVIPIGSTGSLDFLNGLLMLPSYADFELYLHEVSGSWLVRAWQGDYMQAKWGTHGDHPMIALSPSSVLETYTLIIRAFNLAEKYRTPVIFLMDEIVGHMREGVVLPNPNDMIINRRKMSFHDGANKQCYFVPEGEYVPAMKPFGHGERYNITGLAHDISGFPVNSNEIAGKLVTRLLDKVEKNVDDICRVEEYMMDDAETAIVCFGGTARAAMDAVTAARAEGKKVGLFRPITVWPFPEKLLLARLPQLKNILMVEHNHGQMLLEVQRVTRCEKPVHFLGRVDGTVISPADILAKLNEMEGTHHAE